MTTIEFDQVGDFAALFAAKAYCQENGISFGGVQRGLPIGLMYGDHVIPKWRNMSRKELSELDGTIEGNFRDGPIVLQIKGKPDASS